MLDCMKHGRVVEVATYVNDRLGLSSGWICGGEGSFGFPIWNEHRDVCLIFWGEDFTDDSVIERLRANGHEVTSGNLSYLVHLYEDFGLAFLESLNGAFSGLLVDLREHKTVLFNDRYGLNRIYYHETEGRLYFASEAKFLLKVLPNLRSLDLRSLGELISCGCVLQNRTLFSSISLLPPASAWTFAPDQPLKKQIYFRAETWENQTQLAAGEYYEKLKATWRAVLPAILPRPRSNSVVTDGRSR